MGWPVLGRLVTDLRKGGTSPDSLMRVGKKVRRPPGFLRLALASTGQAEVLTWLAGANSCMNRTTFTLDVPAGVDYPMALVVSSATTTSHFRSQVNHTCELLALTCP